MNRAVGRGPEAEGPLGFFRMGCGVFAENVGLDFCFDAEIKETAWTPPDLEADDIGEGYQHTISERSTTGLIELTGSYRLSGPRSLTNDASSEMSLNSRAITLPER